MPEENTLAHLKTLIVAIATSDPAITTNNKTQANVNCFTGESQFNGLNARKADQLPVVISTGSSKSSVVNFSSSTSSSSVSKNRNELKKKWKNEHQSQINASERERKGRLATNIKKLKEIIPVEPIKLQTKESVLEETLTYIKQLKDQIENMILKDASENLAAEMKKLRKQVGDLESERKTFLQILQSHGLLSDSQTKPVKLPLPRFHGKERKREKKKVPSKVSSSTTTNQNASQRTCNLNKESQKSSVAVCSPPVADPISTAHTSPAVTLFATSTTSLVIRLACDEKQDSSLGANMFCSPVHRAVCTPTYSMARMKPFSGHESPKLPSVPTEMVMEKSDRFPALSTTTHETATSTATSSGSSLQASDAGGCSVPKNTCADVNLLAGSFAVSSTPCNPDMNAASTKTSSSLSPASCSADQQQLLSWLRGCGSSMVESSVTSSAAVVATGLKSRAKPVEIAQENAAEMTQSPKKGTNSFNIANLMMSKAAAVSEHVPAASAPIEALPMQKNMSESSGFDTSAPKDSYHQALDSEIFDCLSSFTTPDPSLRQSASVVGTSASDFIYLDESVDLNKANPNTRQRKSTFSSLDIYVVHTDAQHDSTRMSSIHDSHFMPTAENYGDECGNAGAANRDRSLVLGKYPLSYRNQSTAHSGHIPIGNFSTLWQPAVMNTSTSSTRPGNLSQMQSCFSPMSYAYFNNTNHALPHGLGSIDQPLNSNTMWLSPRVHGEEVSRAFPKTPVVSVVEAGKSSRFEPSKKRKLNQANHKASKRKKAHLISSGSGEDTHSISRLIGSHLTTPLDEPHSLAPPQRFIPANRQICYGTERPGYQERVPLFPSPASNPAPSSRMSYNGYGPQCALFPPSSAVAPPNQCYPAPPAPGAGYFSYKPPVASQAPANPYMPRFANVNGNNNVSAVLHKQHKGSQHHIMQILS